MIVSLAFSHDELLSSKILFSGVGFPVFGILLVLYIGERASKFKSGVLENDDRSSEMMTERMALILSRYVDTRSATQQLLSAIRNNRRMGFQLVNTIRDQPQEKQLIWASRLLLMNSGASVGSDDIPDEEFNHSLVQAFRGDHLIAEDARLFLSSVPTPEELR